MKARDLGSSFSEYEELLTRQSEMTRGLLGKDHAKSLETALF